FVALTPPPLPPPSLLPYTTLFRSRLREVPLRDAPPRWHRHPGLARRRRPRRGPRAALRRRRRRGRGRGGDPVGLGVVVGPRTRVARKSTRLNSSHVTSSYAVSCFK